MDIIERINRVLSHPAYFRKHTIPGPQYTRFPPTTLDAFAIVEAELGFPFPDLLKRMYCEIGNGGYGPGQRGLIGIPPDGAKTIDGFYSVNSYPGRYRELLNIRPGLDGFRVPDPEMPDAIWPHGLINICEWGAAETSAIHCLNEGFPVVALNPNSDADDVREKVPQSYWLDGFEQMWGAVYIQNLTFDDWIEQWLEECEQSHWFTADTTS